MGARLAVRLSGAALLLGALTVWLVVGAPGPGAAEFGAVPSAAEHEPDAAAEVPAEADLLDEQEAGADVTGPDTAEPDVTGPDTAEPQAPEPPPFTTTAPRGAIDPTTWPRGVSIPRIGVAAPVLTIGHNTVGELIVPHSPMDVGWFQGGSVPGEPGVALLTSHVDTRTEGRGVFAGLVDLSEGDTVTLTTADGTEQQWTVTARTQHHKSDLPPELFARSGDPVLALVTCGGPFDREARSYRDNVIVWAEPEPAR